MIRRFRAAIAATLLTAGLLIPVMLAPLSMTATVVCPSGGDIAGTGNVYVVLYEYANYDAGYPNGSACIKATTGGSTNISTFKGYHYSRPDGVCDGQLFPSFGTWNDCVTSIKVSVDCHHSVSFYLDENYGAYAFGFSQSGSIADLAFGVDEAISSMKLTYHTACGGAPAP